ncbi:DUF1709-domain-containing protein [Piedraia hortae CBS 480.64]|uniref:DUF1709-domain-containing protein n=1 Tax=Piedraia hortae CBS 480.64 TaxID=1314780 RepID=A0A6A7C521_9PEZI|nr:DUF1709-domain-containing protein [Piedraia hortae CBS 480.64]
MDPVHPLRISKSASSSSNKMARPLSEIATMSQRRNSPSYNQAAKKMIVTGETSPYGENSSPFAEKVSPRTFWSSRETRSPSRLDDNSPRLSPSSPSSTRRASIERLKQASRVKTSNIFALENRDSYDPTSMPVVERPTLHRPQSEQFSNTIHRYDSLRQDNGSVNSVHRVNMTPQTSPRKPLSPSPTKSSLARNSMFTSPPGVYDSEAAPWSDEEPTATPRALHRHNKSVTFHDDPPVINEYEQQTPEPSVDLESREGSWDSEDFEQGDFYYERGSSAEMSQMGDDDSFDADLENADKTPVVLPEDWTRMSPDEARTDLVDKNDDVFDGDDAFDADRPLPPLPGNVRTAEPVVISQEIGQPLDNLQLSELANAPPRISRESILRNVRNSNYDLDDVPVDDSLVETSLSYEQMARMHPDEPIPSTETDSDSIVHRRTSVSLSPTREVLIKQEPLDDGIDMNAIPLMADAEPRSSDRFNSVETDASHYSSVGPEPQATEAAPDADDGKETLHDAMQLLTVKDYTEPQTAPAPAPASNTTGSFMNLPSFQGTGDYDFGLNQYITPSQPPQDASRKAFDAMPTLAPSTETHDDDISPPETPNSVVHNRTSDVSSLESLEPHQSLEQQETALPEPVLPEVPLAPEIPERRSTIKTGGKLKSRPSATAADISTMAEQRRKVSQGYPVPDIPAQYRSEVQSEAPAEAARPASRRASNKPRLDIPIDAIEADDLTAGLDLEFERLLESQKVGDPHPAPSTPIQQASQEEASAAAEGVTPYSPQYGNPGADGCVRTQKGYLMRQNTKVVVASNRNFSNDVGLFNKAETRPMSPNTDPVSPHAKVSPRKPSGEQFLKTEPWNPQARRRSVRNASAQKAWSKETAPPLPHEGLGVVDEGYAAGPGAAEDEVGEGVERGRLFVKVVGVKELDLPLPKNDRLYFQLTLDNGLHCVTTADLDLARSAPIGQEFELVVHNDLEFQLTLTTRLPPPPAAPAPVQAVPARPAKPAAKSALSRFLHSPKKRAERERLEREAAAAEEQRQREEAQRRQAAAKPNIWTLLHELVNGGDGSFARAYVNLKAHENQCFGRPLVVDIPCYNEWALEKDSAVVNSVRSKRGANGPVRRPPYVIGKLELQLLFVPKPKGATEDDMPKSMSSAIREMNKASEAVEIVHEGHLSQQGGDCAHWRRRFFRLQGPRLTAYHENTHQKRAVINLAKATRIVDDRRTLVADPHNPAGAKGRRKSAFAEEDEGYQYVEEGFRIRFANSETIDFYADSHTEKEKWITALGQVLGKQSADKKQSSWTDVVLARETKDAAAAASADKIGMAVPLPPRDFTKPPPPPAQRKAVPSSPTRAPPVAPPQPPTQRPRTPPMAPKVTGKRAGNTMTM